MQQQKQVSAGEGIAAAYVGGRSGGGSVSVCRPSGSRWTPTPEQLRVLKELYYGCGVRSPTAEQIQRITGMLRQHGKVEGKNVFYWFQNHKARERQKRRLTNLDVNARSATGSDVNHLGILSLSPSGAASPSSTLAMYTGNGGASALQLDTTADWDNNTAMAAEGCFVQDYMGVRSTGGGGHGGAGVETPWAWFSPADQRAMTTTTRAPETLPLFPTGDDNRPRPRQGGPGEGSRGGSYYQPDVSFRGPATTATAATTTTTVTIQQHQLLQMQQQYSFYSNNNTQLPGHETQDTAAGAGASLELCLSSSWCSPYHAGTM